MTAIRRRLLPAQARRLVRDAGPPNWWAGLAFVGGGLLGTVLYGMDRVSFPGGVTVLLLAVTVPGLLDRTGWRARIGMAWLALEQRRRMPDMPRTPAAAEQWLREHPDAPLHRRAPALMTAGRDDDALALLNAARPETPEDRARATLVRATLVGLQSGEIDVPLVRSAIADLPADETRYRELALAWSIAWVDSLHGRPWRNAFVAASEGVPASDIPRRWLAGIALQQLVATVAVGIGLVAVLILGVR